MDSTDIRDFGHYLRHYRIAAGLTQEALAERAGVGLRSLQHLERGETRPQRDTAHRLALALALSADQRNAFEVLVQPVPRRRAPDGDNAGATSSVPHNLPAYLTSFVGREREMAEITHLLGSARLLTLMGVGGCGKTRLAVQVATGLLDTFAQGVYVIQLAPLNDPALVAMTVAGALGLREAGEQQLLDTVLGYLRDKDVLLVLDNFEQVVEAAPLVVTLLEGAPRLKVVVTSRTLLRVSGEREFVVPPLRLPARHHLTARDRLLQYDAVALFVQRAQIAKAGFAVTDEMAPIVAEICRRLDGLPLAIELAAARIKLLPPRALLTRLESRLTVLTGGARDLPARQQTLRGTIDWSYDLLGPGEQALFAWLSVFVGGCTLEAVEDVCARAGGVPGDVLDGMTALVDSSLLRQEDPARGEPRFFLLETIREYAHERLAQSGAEGTLRAAHAAYFLTLVERAEPDLMGPRQDDWLARLDQEHDNLRAALRWAHESNRQQVGLRIAAVVWRFWNIRGHHSEGRSWLEGLLAWQETQEASVAPAVVRAKALNGAGRLATQQGDNMRATVLIEKSLALWRELDDTQGIADTLDNLGDLSYMQGDYARSTVLHEESLALYRALGDTQGIASLLTELGMGAYTQGAYARATMLNEESLALHRKLDNMGGISGSLNGLGMIADDQGDYARATMLFEEGLTLQRELGNSPIVATLLTRLGLVAQHQGHYARATMLHEESLALQREWGYTWGIANALNNLGMLAQEQADSAQARVWHEESLALRREISHTWGIAYALNNLGIVAREQGHYARATMLHEESLALRRKIGHTWGIASTLGELGIVTMKRGDYVRAKVLYQESLTLFRDLGDRRNIASNLERLAGVASALGVAPEIAQGAARLLGAAGALRSTIGAPLPPNARADYEATVALLRTDLGDAAFDLAWAQGQRLPLEQTIALAVTEPPPA